MAASREAPVALVTGGARGIGAACAVALARAGFDVAVASLESEHEGSRTTQAIRDAGRTGLYLSFDLADTTSHAELVERVHRDIPYDAATGEFIGVAKFSATGARLLRDAYTQRRDAFWDRPYREAPLFQKAYLIHLFQDMIEQGIAIGHVDTPGRYREIDTQQDMNLAQTLWRP